MFETNFTFFVISFLLDSNLNSLTVFKKDIFTYKFQAPHLLHFYLLRNKRHVVTALPFPPQPSFKLSAEFSAGVIELIKRLTVKLYLLT